MKKRLCILLASLICLASVSGSIVFAEENETAVRLSAADNVESGGGVSAEDGQQPEMPDNGGMIPPDSGGKFPPPWLEEEKDELAPVITQQPQTVKYVTEKSRYSAPEFGVTAKLSSMCENGILRFEWYTDGDMVSEEVFDAENTREYTSTFRADGLKNRPAGVYRVYCKVSTYVGEEVHSSDSYEANFIVCRGIQKNTVITFSDVHEAFSNIGTTLSDCIKNNGGLIPALIVCSGDWVTASHNMGDKEESYENVRDTLIARIALQTGGIDTVYVAGNHDNGRAAAEATRAANLGADADYSGAGIIYDGRVPYADGKQKPAPDVIVIGMNYEEAAELDADGNVLAADYAPVISKLETAFEKIKQDYNGELIIISAHSGLHTLGIQPQSEANEWAGSLEYNIDNSDKLAELLNGYAENVDIVYFFGHDHSKREAEFALLPGDKIISTSCFADKTYTENILKFAYAHAGYITDIIGGREYYSYVRLDDKSFSRILYIADEAGGRVDGLSFTAERKANVKPVEEKEEQSTAASRKSGKSSRKAAQTVYEKTKKTADDGISLSKALLRLGDMVAAGFEA